MHHKTFLIIYGFKLTSKMAATVLSFCHDCMRTRYFFLRSPKVCGVYQCSICEGLKSDVRKFYRLDNPCNYAGCLVEAVNPKEFLTLLHAHMVLPVASIVVGYMFRVELDYNKAEVFRCWFHYDQQDVCERVSVFRGIWSCCNTELLEKGSLCTKGCNF